MSRGRRIEEVDGPPNRGFQVLRLLGVLLCLAADGALLRRFDVPSTLPWVNWTLGIMGSLGALLGLSWAYHHWPRARVFSPFRRAGRKMDPNRRLKFTREGRFLFGISVAVGVAAVNTGNNFLYLVLGLLLALITVSGVLSEAVLRGVTVHLESGGERFAGAPGVLAFHVKNAKGWMSSMSLDVSPLLEVPSAPPQPLQWPGRFLLRLRPGGQERLVVRGTLPRRGVYRLLGFEVATAYPFGFFRKWKHEVPDAGEAREVLGYPTPAPVRRDALRIRALLGERLGGRPGKGEEFFSLRPYREGDDPRRVAWKRSARTGRLFLREDEEPESRRITLVLPCGVAAPTAAQREAFERTVSVAAGLVLELLDRDDEVGLVAGACVVAPQRGAAGRPLLLEALTRVDLSDVPALLPEGAAKGALVLVDGPGTPPAMPRVDLRLGAPPDARRAA